MPSPTTNEFPIRPEVLIRGEEPEVLVVLKIGNQVFSVNYPHDTVEEAAWLAAQLRTALMAAGTLPQLPE